MEKAKIVEALQKALAQGDGSLDDLNNLLKRAQADIEVAKKEEAAAIEKAKSERGDNVAKIATRLLNKELTDADMAFIMNTFFEQHGLQTTWNADNIHTLMIECGERTDRAIKRANEAINKLGDLLKDWGIDVNFDVNSKDAKPAVKPTPKAKDPDDVINDFLKKFGLA